MRTWIMTLVTLAGCAKAQNGGQPGPDGGDGSGGQDASCGELCDTDKDGVLDTADECPNTPAGEPVNQKGCADSQLVSELVPFPPFGLTWTPSGELGRAGGLSWIYVAIQRKDLFHIHWIICDDPATPCGLSLDGPIDDPAEHWTFSATDSDLPGGKVVFTNTMHIALADGTMPQRSGRLTVTISEGTMPLPAADVATLKVTPRDGTHGAEITGTAFTVKVLGEIQDPADMMWKPYADYYDAAPTPTMGMNLLTTSFGGSFYAR